MLINFWQKNGRKLLELLQSPTAYFDLTKTSSASVKRAASNGDTPWLSLNPLRQGSFKAATRKSFERGTS